MPDVERLLVVGFSGLDTHLLRLMKQHMTRQPEQTIFVGGDRVSGTEANFRAVDFPLGDNVVLIPDRFSGLLESQALSDFLAD